ncbi:MULTISPECIES: metallophosphoesterase family protein [unclassified Anabaena]|uniref:metallophosphoesterase family protein n=1 Tax=unclassified Anabaena TaxID=2619674 RepID=UPI0039C68F52
MRPELSDSQWANTFGTAGSGGSQTLRYALTETEGYKHNLEIVNSRQPDFLVMPGDLVQGGGYQPGWDEFFRHNAGEFDSGLSRYPLLPALGNWENFGALNGGYGTDPDGRFGPKFGRDKYHVYFDAPDNGTPEHQDNYYRIDYGPITIITLDSSNGEPSDRRSNYGGEEQSPKISGRDYTGPGTDTQENYTREQYEAAGGTDLADFNPGSPQWNWAEAQLEDARNQGQIIFVQFHHAPYSSGEHGQPMNHELSTGQGGTPMRQYQSMFEQYGVLAVLSGHSEMFERSFVDENGDGIGVYYYDVGVSGDGLRGEKRDGSSLSDPLLKYNSFSQWTADQNAGEFWQEMAGALQLVDGGKHYGHLEVNVERVGEGESAYAKITLSPVYSFPILDSNYNLVRTERRVYGDEITLLAGFDGQIVKPVPEHRSILGLLAWGFCTAAIKFAKSSKTKPVV